jgi:hypothetical protein
VIGIRSGRKDRELIRLPMRSNPIGTQHRSPRVGVEGDADRQSDRSTPEDAGGWHPMPSLESGPTPLRVMPHLRDCASGPAPEHDGAVRPGPPIDGWEGPPSGPCEKHRSEPYPWPFGRLPTQPRCLNGRFLTGRPGLAGRLRSRQAHVAQSLRGDWVGMASSLPNCKPGRRSIVGYPTGLKANLLRTCAGRPRVAPETGERVTVVFHTEDT